MIGTGIVPVRCPLPGPFATATAVEPAAPGQWSASIHPGWVIAGNANGGYLLAVATRALAGATGRPDPVTVTAHYLSPASPAGSALPPSSSRRESASPRASRRCPPAAVRCWRCRGPLGDLSRAQGPELIEGAPPELPPPEQCVRVHPAGTFPLWVPKTCVTWADALQIVVGPLPRSGVRRAGPGLSGVR